MGTILTREPQGERCPVCAGRIEQTADHAQCPDCGATWAKLMAGYWLPVSRKKGVSV